MLEGLVLLFGGILAITLCVVGVYCAKEYFRKRKDQELVDERLKFRYQAKVLRGASNEETANLRENVDYNNSGGKYHN